MSSPRVTLIDITLVITLHFMEKKGVVKIVHQLTLSSSKE